MSEPIYQCFVTDDDDQENDDRLWMDVKKSAYDELTKRDDVRGRLVYSQENFDALSAVVERQREALNDLLSADEQAEGYGVAGVADDIRDKVRDVLALTPATALRLHDAEVLERHADQMEALLDDMVSRDYIVEMLRDEIARLRAGGEG